MFHLLKSELCDLCCVVAQNDNTLTLKKLGQKIDTGPGAPGCKDYWGQLETSSKDPQIPKVDLREGLCK